VRGRPIYVDTDTFLPLLPLTMNII